MLKTKIEWADSTWSPVTGCLHGCPYCYARSIASRFRGCDASPTGETSESTVYLTDRQFKTTKSGNVIAAAYPYGFIPTFHEYRLGDPERKGFGKTIFVCSTSDLFGWWVPDAWIQKIFAACGAAKDHRYLFLTKNPDRLFDLMHRDMLPAEGNYWYGTTVTTPSDNVFHSDRHRSFVSIEPVLAPFRESSCIKNLVEYVDWAIIGAETGNRKNKVVPERDWIVDIVAGFKDKGKPVFMKNSLLPIWGNDILTECPWED